MKKEFNSRVVKVVESAKADGINIHEYAIIGYNSSQLKIICNTIKHGIDVSIFKGPQMTTKDMQARYNDEVLKQGAKKSPVLGSSKVAPTITKELKRDKHDKSAIIKLVMKYKGDKDTLEQRQLVLESVGEDIDIINKEEDMNIVNKDRLSKEDYLDKVKILDTHRRMCHNTIISGIKRINWMCKENNIPLFYNGDETDRVQIAEFVMKVVEQTFKDRKK